MGTTTAAATTATAAAAVAAAAEPAAAVAGAGGSFESAAGAAAAVVVPCLRQAVARVRLLAAEERRLKSGRRVHVLVTGSLYLVGDMLRLLGKAG
jgi:folylpolyglutamate synthase